jgi:tRNA 2-thiouridine synthesizing protein A
MSGRRARLFGRATATAPTEAPVTGSVPLQAERAALQAERAAGKPVAPAPALTIDALGRECPIPIIMLAEQIRDIPRGEIVAVLADDPAAYTDIPSWCMLKSQEFAGYADLPGGGWALYIRRVL